MVRPDQKRAAVRMMQAHNVSQRRACQEIGVSRSSMVYKPRQPFKDEVLAESVKALSEKYPRFGYRRIGVMLGWEMNETINAKRIYRLWTMLNLQLPKKRPRRRRPGTDPIKLQSGHINHVWSYDFVSDRAANGQKLKILVVVDEYTRECLALEVAASIRTHHLIDTLSRLMTLYGRPKFIRSDNGPEFTAKAVIQWLTDNDIGPAFIKPGSPWQNAYVESFNGKFRDECLNREWFYNRKEAAVIIEKWRNHYNHERPHSSLDKQPPAKVSGRKYVA
ncbi:mobile element protein [Hydrogenimonas sp.]|nr:mobile element protein [Hydrogenimonas sp.]BBG65865.1 mobile element protein [Hydrogenimonas sp.]BBG66477.1 mobile element protein [Hydrogenimonas sp.]BBG66596.1 mobile element protein [Hydrogenimonas sp.]BBG66610.1 mobile element protein [Hydrogenimonas sp.]